MSGTTQAKLIEQFSDSILTMNEAKVSDFVAMDNGKFFIGSVNKGILISFLAKKQADGDFKLGLVPVLANKTIFFADVDHVPHGFDLKYFLCVIANKFNEFAKGRTRFAAVDDLIIFKHEKELRYHVYIPVKFGEVSKAERALTWKSVNAEYAVGGKAGDIIDEAANTIRIEGFEKWDRETKTFKAGSRYVPIGAASEVPTDKLFEQIWLNPRGWNDDDDDVASLPLERQYMSVADELAIAAAMSDDVRGHEQKSESEAENNAQSAQRNHPQTAPRGVRRRAATRNNPPPPIASQSAPRPNASRRRNAPNREGSADIVTAPMAAAIETKIKTNFSEIAHILCRYPIVTIKQHKGNIATFICDKSTAGRTCEIANSIHGKNNIYFTYYGQKKMLYQKCFSPKCQAKNPVLIHKIEQRKAIFDNYGVPTADEASLAQFFVLSNPLISVRKSGKTWIWYIYDSINGYWETSTFEHVMQMIMNDFSKAVEDKFDEAIEKADDADVEDLIKCSHSVMAMLKSVRTLKNIAECIRWKLAAKSRHITWNRNTNYTVFPNGVLQIDKRDPDNDELYYFGKTKPTEYINDAKCMRFPFNCPPVNFDGHYIQQAEELLEDWIKLVQPEAEDRMLLLMFVALSLKAVNYKKMIINIGRSGDNSKSSFYEMIVYLSPLR